MAKIEDQNRNLKEEFHSRYGKQLKKLKKRIVEIAMSPVRLFKTICFTLGFICLVSICGTGIYLYFMFSSFPTFERSHFDKLEVAAKKKLKKRLENKRKLYRWTKINEVNRDYLYAIVLSEDATFFEHDGVNFDAILDSLARNIRKREYAYGASTISQQVVKNLFLTNEKSVIRKFKEYLITQDMEAGLTKNQILELYLNIAEFGPDIFGVRAASHHFFGKTPKQINAAEGAFIALMLPSPRRNHYSIFQNRNLTRGKKKKIRRVLRDMLYEEYISARQYKRYIKYNYFSKARRPARR